MLNPASAQSGGVDVTGAINAGGGTVYNPGDITTANSATTGTVRFGQSNNASIYFDGTNLNFTASGIFPSVSSANGQLRSISTGTAPWFILNQINGTAPTGDLLDIESNAGSPKFSISNNGVVIQPGVAQHGILSITTPSTCTALSACASGSVTFTTAMTAATYECTANSETYPYVVEVNAKTTTEVTFEIYNLVAVSAAQTVPVDYACAV